MTKQLWDRYSRIWTLEDSHIRGEMEQCLAPEICYTDPNICARGWAQFSGYMQGFKRGFPGYSFAIQSVLSHHGCSVARWNMLDASGNIASPGVSFARHAEDGKFLEITGFFGDAETKPT